MSYICHIFFIVAGYAVFLRQPTQLLCQLMGSFDIPFNKSFIPTLSMLKLIAKRKKKCDAAYQIVNDFLNWNRELHKQMGRVIETSCD